LSHALNKSSELDIGWRIVLVLMLIGALILFVQRRSQSNSENEVWMQESIEGAQDEPENKPKSAPSLEFFE